MPAFRFGVDYYPEQWPCERWAVDAGLMREAGFNLVRLAEFAWVRLEPCEAEFDFAWLDEAIAVLHAHGLEVVLGTPTASPPAWLHAQNPEMFRTLHDGRLVTYGHRRGPSPHHAEYQRHARRITEALAQRYASHPAVIGWQIDNEFGDRDYGPAARAAFHAWLEREYTTLDALNAAWGTVFWGHTYGRWSEVPVPLESAGGPHNPGLALDFARFSSQAYTAFQRQQLEIIRTHCPGHFVTHNLMGFGYETLDYFDLAADLDFVSWDNYPRIWWNVSLKDDPSRAALGHATMRGVKRKNFWVMEQQAGPGGWEQIVPQPRPGELRLWAYQGIAHGADGMVFFRFRTARHGAEQYWHGLLEHDGRVGRRYAEVAQMGRELERIGELIAGSVTRSSVALMLSYDARFAFQVQQNNPNLQYSDQFQYWYGSLHRRQTGADIVAPSADLSSYRLVIAPLLHIVTPAIARNLERFVQNGGTLVLTARSGVKDERNAVVNAPLPGLLRQLAGVEVAEYDSLIGSTNAVVFDESGVQTVKEYPVTIWCDVLEPHGAHVIARYARGYYAGRAAITDHAFGRGRVVYVGALGDRHIPDALTDWLLERCEIQPVIAAPAGVEVTERSSNEQCFVFALNHTDGPQTVELGGRYRDLVTGDTLGEHVQLEPFGVRILEVFRG